MLSIQNKVELSCPNNEQDVRAIIELLKVRSKQSKLKAVLRGIDISVFGSTGIELKLVKAIKHFQKYVQKMNSPDGVISPNGNTILFLGGIRLSGKQIIVDLDERNLYAYNGVNLRV